MEDLVFDKRNALIRLDGDDALLAIVVETYMDDFPLQLVKIREALVASDLGECRRVAHSIKGASANIGASRLRNVAMEIEKMIKEADLKAAIAMTEQLESEFKLLQQEIAAE